ncbi:uncharacterized protein RJT20DRAFT_90691 [Scheffersomyces xylosifermentans]|uniref:uncharacterized protein n=1 Tax=Scheffersomyces xylosifermentans TaxID=1304137 RepID=UPI00315C76A9
MAKEKRTKPCSNCKKSKVKCIYTSTLPCERCIRTGQGMNCMFVPKLPSLKLPPFPSNGVNTHPHTLPHSQNANVDQRAPNHPLPPLNPIGIPNGLGHAVRPQGPPQDQFIMPVSTGITPSPPQPQQAPQDSSSDSQWKTSIENRMNTFDNKLSDLVDILRVNQQYMIDNQKLEYINHSPQRIHHHQQQSTIQYPEPIGTTTSSSHKRNSPESRSSSSELSLPELKRLKYSKEDSPYPKDFRNGFLTQDQARKLFQFFDANIAQQLFGFEISKVSVESIWDSCPVLVCAICAIASIHHPDLSYKSKQLQVYLQDLCQTLLFKGKPATEEDGFHTIVALILCSFWLSDSQMFTGIAMQLAKEYRLNNPYTKNKDKLKLWYLLYVLDGQQSLTFNRQPLVNSQEYSLKHSREILLSDQKKITNENGSGGSSIKMLLADNDEPSKSIINNKESSTSETSAEVEKRERRERFTDMKLVSQVEYNQALNEAFQGNAWDLLAPSSFGIPSKSNLELDKWMVSWTVLLAPGNNGAVWSSKSTLIYYNFAKMHINSSAVRKLQVNPNDTFNMFPKWEGPIVQEATKRIEFQNDQNSSSDSESEEASPSDDDEFISNEDIMSKDETIVTANIAVSAAQTVLNLVINDNDILDNLKYVPVHIHIMLYYAALLLINPPLHSNNKSVEFKESKYYSTLLNNIRVIKTLQKKIYNNLPIDTKFGNRLIRSLDEIVEEKLSVIKKAIMEMPEDDTKNDLSKHLTSLTESGDAKNIYEVFENDSTSSRGSTPGVERISAWPGSNHGHP